MKPTHSYGFPFLLEVLEQTIKFLLRLNAFGLVEKQFEQVG